MNAKLIVLIILVFLFNGLKAEENTQKASDILVQRINQLEDDVDVVKSENVRLKNELKSFRKDYK